MDRHGLIVFLVWQSLAYGARMTLSILLVLTGLAIQVFTGSFLTGAPLLLAGNILLLVRGYDNRVDVKGFRPGVDWQKVERARLDEILRLDEGIRRWDRSVLDVTNLLGAAALLLTALALGAAALLLPSFGRIIALDAMVLLLPHWFTGIRRILRLPQVVVRAEALAQVLDASDELVSAADTIDILMLLKGSEVRVPDDVKFRVSFVGQDPRFLGLYGQVVINTVQGKSYPYFYTVLVAEKGYGLKETDESFTPPGNIVHEYGTDNEVEFIVVRQKTTRNSGYHTKGADAIAIFFSGCGLAREAAFPQKKV
ncbi:MAG: hypothetical protein C4534_00270 [Gaiellales bacterium]|nr:MAG: hypothetical protein C4534_00270 [Gaiellales bacterium]